MTAWVDCHTAPSYFGGWAADMGIYTGPWPLLPPGVIGPDPYTYVEIDFYIALPNPSDVTDVTIVADGSYDTPLWDSYRFGTGNPSPDDTGFGYYGDWLGTLTSVPPTAPAGAHLYVVYYGQTPVPLHVPPNPPEFYTPPTYAAGGLALFETAMGHWSPDQAGFTQSKPVNSDPGYGGDFYHEEIHSYLADHDIAAQVAADVTAILAATPGTGLTSTGVEASKVNLTSPFALTRTDVRTAAGMQLAHYNGTTAFASNDQPAYLSSLDAGVDYSDTPYIASSGNPGTAWQYDSPPTWTWDDAHPVLYGEDVSTGSSYPGAQPLPLGLDFRLQWSTTSIPGTPWTVTETLLIDLVSVTPNALRPVDYSAISALEFWFHAAPKFLYDGGIPPVVDFAMPSPGHNDYSDNDLFTTSGSLALKILKSTWQYWVPGAIISTTPSEASFRGWGIAV